MQQEIDYLEESEGKTDAYEFKWTDSSVVKFPKSFLAAYPEATLTIVTRKNFTGFLLGEN